MKKYKTGLFIGRFQPFHLGHLSALRQGLEQVEKIILVIGSANQNFSLQNPLTITERMSLVKKVIVKEKLSTTIPTVIPFNDHPDNLFWLDSLIKSIPPFDVVIGNNNLVTVLTKYRNYPQFHPKLTKREKLQGVVIRENILKSKSWENYVPQYTLPLLKKFKLSERLRALQG
ncbi:MAG: nicotinamide-nucleotide adenylyltransferase [Patescibacteria group bacterium]|jgi:nicotinamide-nucleotide adenylyltransferase